MSNEEKDNSETQQQSSDTSDDESNNSTDSASADASAGNSSSEQPDEGFDEEGPTVILEPNVVQMAAIETVKRQLWRSHVHTSPTGNYAAMRTTGDVFRYGDKNPWDVVNPSGVHPKDERQPIFSYDLSLIPNSVEDKPWTATGADITDWFNYGFNEQTWEKYRRKMLQVIRNKQYESKISVLTEQTKRARED
jgi:pre-mRNA 3'-end-processing factor FIP1